MERHIDMAEDLPEEKEKDLPEEKDKMFTAEDIPEIVRIFREADADGSGGLDVEEFCVAMQKLYRTVSKEELIILHMQIDTNCDKTVDIGELLSFLLDRKKALERMYYKNQTFPKPFKNIRMDHYKAVVGLLFYPYEDEPDHSSNASVAQVRPYKKGQYLSISSDGILNFWTDRLDTAYTIALCKKEEALPFSHTKKMCVTDMVYLRELKQLAISTSDRELLFYHCSEFPDICRINHALIVEDNIVNTMNYWSNGTKAVFSFGDVKGYLSIFISYNVQENGLFCKEAYEKISLQKYPTVYVSALLKKPYKDFLYMKFHIIDDMCSQIQYFPSLDSFTICGNSSKTMVLSALTKAPTTKVSKKVFKSSGDKEFFTCVEYSHWAARLVTGGTDGLLRVWFPHRTTSCERALIGHVKPVTHIKFNPKDKIFVSLSEDKNVRVWSENGWLCMQSFQIQDMGRAPVSSMCYNIYNNELVLANADIAKCMGRGTDVFKDMLTSHDKPLCAVLYHSIFRQVLSVCQDGVVTVWDILTGKAVMQFKVTPDQHVGLTAMSFDGPQRRLITVSQDGKVRLWNFNTGAELAVLPVTVPKDVTGIVCINNRLFVSGRNSKIIFDLDLEDYGKSNNRFFEHDYLNDICSMDVHENTLVTASSNGNIIIWDVDSAEVLYWLNGSKSPRTRMAGKRDQGWSGSLPANTQKNVRGTGRRSTALTGYTTEVNISPLVICLKTREVSVATATLLTSADGYIYAWSVISKGGLLGKFRAVNDDGAVITTMYTDASEQILLTGDSTGRIYLWDIQGFGFKRQADKGPFEELDGWLVSLCPPPLLRSWQSHPTKVVSVKCDLTCKNLITAGMDCNVRLWTDTGCCVGVFGRDIMNAKQISPEEKVEEKQAKRPGTAKTRDFKISLPDFPKSSSLLQAIPPNVRNLQRKIEEGIQLLKTIPILSHEELMAKYRNALKITSELNKMKDKTHLQHLLYENDKNATQQGSSGTDLQQNSPQTGFPYLNQTTSKYEHVSKQGSEKTPEHVHLPQTPLPTGHNNDTKSSPHMQLLVNTVKQGSDTSRHVHFSPIPGKGQLTNNQTQFKPHPPQTLLTTDSPNTTKSSPHMQLSVNTVKQGSDTSRHVRFPPIPGKGQLTNAQSQFKPHPPQTPLTTGRTNATKSSPRFSRGRH